MHPLDNPAWHALTGPHRTLAEVVGAVRRYPPDVAPFVALPDEVAPPLWDELGELVGPGGMAVLFRDDVEPPTGWELVFRAVARQMVATEAVEASTAEDAVVLGPDDVPEMLDLVRRTEPGPFGPRTVELGTYLGVRDGGELVAMAGERMHPPEHSEISGVCTAPSHRGRGLAGALVRDLAGRIRARGELPFLHALVDNTNAIRLYEQLGFETRRVVAARVLRRAP